MTGTNDTAQWVCILAVVAAFAVFGWVQAVDAADRLAPPVALCPNYDSVRVMPTHWDAAKRSHTPVRTIPSTCGDTTAVTFGYLR